MNSAKEKELHVFYIDDYTWFVGYEEEETWQSFLESEWGSGTAELDDDEIDRYRAEVYQLTKEQLDSLSYTSDSGVTFHTFGDELRIQAEKAGKFPRFFATTEW